VKWGVFMSFVELKNIYGEKSIPDINDAILAEASAFAIDNNCTLDDALLYILDMMIEKPFGE
jgi:hypothetical protein